VSRPAWAVVAIGVLAAACTSAASPAASPAASSSAGTEPVLAACPAPGAPAAGDDVLPDLSLPCLGAAEGAASVPLRRLTGRPTVVNLWASWCGPCREELPALARLSRAAGERLRVVGVASLDVPTSSVSFAADSRLPFPSLQDRDGDLERGLRRNGLPVTVLVRADGTVAYVYQGAPLTDTTLRELVRDKLGVHV
jgi:cytochrome c biogenesis protein CcmG, thiol:disulfide interchange protein DsbE